MQPDAQGRTHTHSAAQHTFLSGAKAATMLLRSLVSTACELRTARDTGPSDLLPGMRSDSAISSKSRCVGVSRGDDSDAAVSTRGGG
jgi:hypothetical protein